VIFCEHKLMYDLRAEVPDEPYTIRLAKPTSCATATM